MVLMTEQDRLRASLEQLVDRYGRQRSSLLPILQDVQRQYYHVSEYAMQVIADLLGHPPGRGLQRRLVLQLPGRQAAAASS